MTRSLRLLASALLALTLAGCGSDSSGQPGPTAANADPAVPTDATLQPERLALPPSKLGADWVKGRGSRLLSDTLLQAQDPAWASFLTQHGRQATYRAIYTNRLRVRQCVIGVFRTPADATEVEKVTIQFTLLSKHATQLGDTSLVTVGPDGGHSARYVFTPQGDVPNQASIVSWSRGILALSCVEVMKDGNRSEPRDTLALAVAQDRHIVRALR